MSILIALVLIALVLLGLGGAAVIFLVYRRGASLAAKPVQKQQPPEPARPAVVQKPSAQTSSKPLSFRWSHAAFPLAILIIYIILAVVFYPRLPAEVSYRFADGKPDGLASRGVVVVIGLVIQLIFAAISLAIAWGVTRARLLSQTEGVWISPQRILWFMGNMVAMPQAVLAFAMADIFSYNSFQVHLIPVWVFALIVMGVGGIVIGGMFVVVILRAMAGSGRTTR